MTSADSANARAAAVAAVRQAQGLTGIAPIDWTYEQRVAYNQALAAYISARPEQFSDQELLTAEAVSKQVATPLEDTSFDFGMFASEVGNNVISAGEDVAAIGKGVLNTAAMASWLIPLAGAALVGIFLFGQYKKATA